MIEPSLKKWFRVKYLPVLFERSPPVSNFYNSLTLSPLFTLYLMVKPLFSLQKEVKIWNANLQTAVTGRFSRLMDRNICLGICTEISRLDLNFLSRGENSENLIVTVHPGILILGLGQEYFSWYFQLCHIGWCYGSQAQYI